MKIRFSDTVFAVLSLLMVLISTAQAVESKVNDQPLTPVTMQIRWLHQFQFAGYYAALHKGFYRDRGLDVSIVEGSPTRSPVSEVLAGRAQYGVANSELLYLYLQGEKLVALAAIFQHSPSVLLSRNDSGIRTPQDMIGKRVMMIEGKDDIEFLAMLANEGINTDDIKIIPSSFDIHDLIVGKVEVFNAYLTNEPYYLKEYGVEGRTIEPVNYGIDFYSDILFTTQDEIKKHPDRVKAFREASLLGWEYAMSHQEEIIDLILAEYGSVKSRAHLEYEAKTMEHLIHPDLIPMGNINLFRFQRMADLMVKLRLAETDYSLEDFIYDPDPKVKRKVFVRTIILISFLLVISWLIAVLLWKYSQRLSLEVARRRNTERAFKDSERNLRKTWDSLKQAQEIAHLGSWVLDLVENKLSWSDEVFRIFEIDSEQFGASYEAFMDAVHPDDRELVNNAYNQSVENKTIYHIEHRLLMKDERVKYVQERGKTFFDVDGKPLKSVGTVLDITESKQAEEILISLKEKSEQSENKFRAITNQSTEGITVADTKGNYTFVNPAFCKMMGYSEEELLHKTVFDVKAPEQDTSSFARSKDSEEGLPIQVLLQRKDGTVFISEVIGKMIEFDGQMQVLGTVRDITEQVKAEEKIRTLSLAIEQSPVSVIITDTDTNIEYVNSAFENVTGYSAAEVIGKNPRLLNSDRTYWSQYKELWQAITSGKQWQGELQNRKKNGEIYWEYSHFAPVIDASGSIRHYLAVKEDITMRKQQEEQILHQAHFDTLTDLPNRFLSLDRLSQLLNEAQRDDELVAILFLDLDDFKKINDTLGHETGDKLLIEAAERLRNVVRSGDTVGRLGGDEFIVLLGGLTHGEDAHAVAENLLNRFRDAFSIDGRELMLTVSIGIAFFPDDGDNASELLRNADSAMYHSKELGRNTYSYFTEAMNRDVSRRLALEEQFHGALDRGEFTIIYQPQIDITSGKIMGAEALLRWFNPALGNVSPVEFIPIAEQTGLIVPLGQFVLNEVLSMTSRWQKDHDPKFRMAVNLSPRQFRDPDLVNFIEEAICQAGVTSDSLELEITEGVLMNDHGYISDTLAALSKLGVKIAMDDFGTGYSSLSYLRIYPFDILKIDRSFISDITKGPAGQELINATVAMAHGLNMKVVAEGVETEEQFNYLKDLGCDYAQGYLFSKPVSVGEISRMLEMNSANDLPGVGSDDSNLLEFQA